MNENKLKALALASSKVAAGGVSVALGCWVIYWNLLWKEINSKTLSFGLAPLVGGAIIARQGAVEFMEALNE